MRGEPRSEQAQIAELAWVMASSTARVSALLDLAVSCADATGAALLKVEAAPGSWHILANTAGFDAWNSTSLKAELDDLVASAAGLIRARVNSGSGWEGPQPLQDGLSSALGLYGARQLLGVVVVLGCSPAVWSSVPYSVATGLTMCLTGEVIHDTARVAAELAQRSAREIRRLFEEGAHAADVAQAGAVLARVVADAFQTERAAIYVVDEDGIISVAVRVGVPPEISDDFAAALIGKVAADSPGWRTLERLSGPLVVDDASQVMTRPGGLVQTLGLVSYVALPLLSSAGLLGMVICGEAASLRVWTPNERQLAAQLALEGALIIDAARLRASERAQLALITRQAFHDGLTGAPNRRLLMDRLDRALDAARRSGTRVAMLVLDLNDFKQVNDTLGHHYGDELLREVAARLTAALRRGDTLARLGGDEFAILICDGADIVTARAVAARVEDVLAVPVNLGGIFLNAVASIGIALFPDHATTSADLLQRADIAMYAAKRAGNGPATYEPAEDNSTVDKLILYTELRRAIANSELVLVYQPKLDLRRNTITGVEALVRWPHPRRGLLAPGDFLPMAESSGLIHPLTAWVLEHALRQSAAWQASGLTLDLAVNISARNLLDTALLTRMSDLIQASQAGDRLTLEVTETAAMLGPKDSVHALDEIRSLGVRISMDDFGTGYSSLAQLGQLSIDELKVDRLIVQNVETSEVNRALIAAVVGIGHHLGLTIVAEGIETLHTLETIRELGCDLGQGYFISVPVSPAEISELVQIPRVPVSKNRRLA